jgi:uncharacterized protein (TIGR02444 family)
MHEEDSELWAFAAGVYGQATVEEVCLGLQDDHQADIVLVLFLTWLGLGGKPVSSEEMQALLGIAHQWQQSVVGPLREIRRQLKAGEGEEAEQRYTSLKAIELESERLELQCLLEAAAPGGFVFALRAGSKATAMANLQSYFETNDKAASWAQVKESAALIVDRAVTWLGR